MRFRRLDLIAFGHFTDVSLDLRQPGLHLVYGPNESGKSTALRAVHELLFGMPVRTDLAFRHPMNRLRVGALLEGPSGETLEVVRRKGRLDTLRTPADEVVPESALTALLGGVGRPLYLTMFGLDHEGLVAGGEELLRGEGEVGQSLFGAALGAGRVRSLLAELEGQADEVYRPRGARTLNQALGDYDAARRRVRELQLRPQQWLALNRALEEAAASRARLDDRLLAQDTEVRRLRHLQAALPLVVRRERLLARAAELGAALPGQAAEVPAALEERHRQAAGRIRAAMERERETAEQLAEVEQALAALTVDDALLARAAEIRALVHGRGRYDKDARDLETLRGRQSETFAQAGALLRQVWPEMQAERADRELRLTAVQRDRLDTAITRHPVLRERAEQARRTAARVARELERRRARLAALGEPPDPAALQRALDRSRPEGELGRALDEARRELAACEREAGGLRAQLGLGGRSLEEVARLPVPTRERVTHFRVERVRLEEEARAAEARAAELEGRRAEFETTLRALTLAGRVPSMEELRAARARREEGWRLVRRAWREAADVTVEARAYAGERPLPDAYADAVARADQVADDLRDAGERVVQAAQARAGLEACERAGRGVEARRRRLEADRRALDQRWAAEWAPAGLAPGPPEEMQGWLDRHAGVVAAAARSGGLRAAVEAARAALEGQRGDLARALAELGRPAPHGEALDDLRPRAERVAAGLSAEREERRVVLAAVAELELQQRELRVELDSALADLAAWDAEWAAALEPLRLPAATSPTAAAVALRRLGEAIVKIDESNVLRARRDGIRRDIQRYEEGVRALVEEVAPDLRDRPAPAAAAELEERLARGRDRHAQRRERLEAREALRGRAGRLREALERDRQVLMGLMAKLGAGSLEELDGLIERAGARRAVAEALAQCESELLQQGAGWTVEEHVRQAAGASPERLAAEVAAAEERLRALRGEHEEAVRVEAAARAELDRLDGSGAAAEAAADVQEQRARVLAEASRLLRLEVAHAILHREIELYRERHQAPLLRRSGEVFREVTLGRYDRLKAETDARERAVIVGVRADGEERSVAEMSSGTRDQLYLALRLATLATHLETSVPLPVVLDDILINFDDDRARATLQVLARLARDTQVLLFTHHGRLLEVARSALPAGAFTEHVLPPDGRSAALSIAHSAA